MTCPVATAPCPSGLAQTRNFTYDNRGFLTSETHPEKGPSGNGTVTYPEYDARGHTLRRVDGGFDLKFAYDRAERLFEVKETGGSQRVLKSFTYGDHLPAGTPSNGKLEIATRRNYPLIGGSPFEVNVTETYTYAGEGGRVSQRSTLIDDHGLNQFAYTQSWVYDDLGNPTSLGYPQCTSVPPPADNGCFSQGGALPRSITNTYTRGWLTGIPNYLSSITYHNNLQMNVMTHSNGVTVTYAKDPNQMQRPASIATSAGWSTGSYAYDGSGNIVRIGPLLSGSWYLYDGVSRMVQSSTRTGPAGGGGTATQNVSFDPFGNIQSITNDGTVRSTPTSGSTNRLTGAVGYDGAGSLTSWNGNTYEYGPFGEMSAYRSGTESWLYLYTVDEERVRAYDLARSIGHFSIRDLDGRLLREYRSNSWTTPKDYVYRSDGRLVSSIEGPTLRHLHVDHLGSVRQITNSSGASVEYHVFYPFGEEATATGTEQMKFTGHERDLANPAGTADDLDYMHKRHFSPLTGRFLQLDPARTLRRTMKRPQMWNRYGYVAGNPLKYIDPSGEVAILIGNAEAQKKSLAALRSIVPPELRIFVRTTTTKDGKTIVDPRFLNARSDASSGNFQTLRIVANSPGAVEISTSATSFTPRSGTTEALGESGTAGVFLDSRTSSPTPGVSTLLVGGDLGARDSAVALAHELRHASLYLQGLSFLDEYVFRQDSLDTFTFMLDPNGPVNALTRAAEAEAEAHYDSIVEPP